MVRFESRLAGVSWEVPTVSSHWKKIPKEASGIREAPFHVRKQFSDTFFFFTVGLIIYMKSYLEARYERRDNKTG